MLSEVLFKEGQEPTLDNWDWAIGALEASYDACKDPLTPRDETEPEDEEDFKLFEPSIRSDLDLMRKIAKIDNHNPTQQLAIDLLEITDEVWERWEAAALDGASGSEDFKKGIEESQAALEKVIGGDTDTGGGRALMTAIIERISQASTEN